VFVSYEGKRAGDIAVSRYAVRNLVSQEIEAELLRRHQAAFPQKAEHAMFKK
jgi:chromosome transmission fidelity protein 18